jgi:hypothetical protein
VLINLFLSFLISAWAGANYPFEAVKKIKKSKSTDDNINVIASFLPETSVFWDLFYPKRVYFGIFPTRN